jgi:hypothetical protein
VHLAHVTNASASRGQPLATVCNVTSISATHIRPIWKRPHIAAVSKHAHMPIQHTDQNTEEVSNF